MATPATMIRLNADIPKNLHKQFKLACLIREETMTDVLTAFIDSYIKVTNKRNQK